MLKHAAVFITLATAGLYTLGLAFHLGFLAELGIEETLFPLSLDRTLFQGFVSFTHMGVKAIVLLLVAAEGIVLVGLAANLVISLAKKSDWLENKTATLIERKNESSRPPRSGFVQFAHKMLVYSSVLFIVFMGTLVVVFLSDIAGRESALKLKENVRNGLLKTTSIALKEGNKELKGVSIVCNQNQCAYYVGSQVVIVNLSDIKSETVSQ